MKPEQYDPLEGRHTPLALRKQMLILRASLQREELAQQVRAFRGAVPPQAGWLNAALGSSNLQRVARLWSLARQNPSWGSALGTAASWGLSRWRWPAMRHVGLALSLAWLAWQGWRLVSAHQRAGSARQEPARTGPGPSAPRDERAEVPGAASRADRGVGLRAGLRVGLGAGLGAAQPSAGAPVGELDLSIARRLASLARRLDSSA